MLFFCCLCYIAAFLVQSLIQLSPISQLILSLFPLFSEPECAESVHMHTYMPTWWSAYGMHTCHCPCICAHTSPCMPVWVCASLSIAACGFSCRGVDHDTAVNLKRKLINWSTSDSSTSSPQSGLCSLTLGKNCHVLQRGWIRQVSDGAQRRKKKRRRDPPALLLPLWHSPQPFISLIMSVCQRKGGVIKKKESQNRRKHLDLRQAWRTSTGLLSTIHVLTDSYAGKSHCLMAERHTQTSAQTVQKQGAHLESTHCANMGRGLSLLS